MGLCSLDAKAESLLEEERMGRNRHGRVTPRLGHRKRGEPLTIVMIAGED